MRIREELEKAIDKPFIDAFNRADAAALGNMYTENGLVLSPGYAEQRGPKAIAATYKEGIDAGQKITAFNTIEADSDGALAYRVGTIEAESPTKDGSIGKTGGKFCEIYKRQADGTWRIQVSMYYEE